jgi:hypothetical protein
LEARQKADDVAAARAVVAALKAIPGYAFTPIVAGHIAAALSAAVTSSGWSHFEHASEAVGFLDDAHDTLGAV